MFGLHPKMAPLSGCATSGELAAVHAVGLPVPNRSHFSAMEEIEDADPGSLARRGWVNRMIGLNDAPTAHRGRPPRHSALPDHALRPGADVRRGTGSQTSRWSRHRRRRRAGGRGAPSST